MIRPCKQSPQVDGLVSYLIEASFIIPSTFDPLIKYTVAAVAINNTVDRDAKAVYSTDLTVLVPSPFLSGLVNINYFWSLFQRDIPLSFAESAYTIEATPTLLDAEPTGIYTGVIGVQESTIEIDVIYSGIVQPTESVLFINSNYTGVVRGDRPEGIDVVWSGIVEIPTIIDIQNLDYTWSLKFDPFDDYIIASEWTIEAEPTLFILPGGTWTIEAVPITPVLLEINISWLLTVEPQWPEAISLSIYTGEAQPSPPLSAFITYSYSIEADPEPPKVCFVEVLVGKFDRGVIVVNIIRAIGISNP